MTITEWLDLFRTRLQEHEHIKESDPQANPVKLLAYDISKFVETRELAFRDIEAIVKTLSDEWAVKRAKRLRRRSGLDDLAGTISALESLACCKAEQGFDEFKKWAESAGQGIVLTAHPTFSLSREVRDVLGKIATCTDNKAGEHIAHLKTLPYLPKRAPTLQEEHADAQDSITRIQVAISRINEVILDIAQTAFPDDWTRLTPCLIKVYSWVGYDIDGRTDISWGDAIRLRLLEKSKQIERYLQAAETIAKDGKFSPDGQKASQQLIFRLNDAAQSSAQDLSLFLKDMRNTDNLVAAANFLTRKSDRRLRSTKELYPLIEQAISGAKNGDTVRAIIKLKAQLRTFGLGSARIHFRLNARHVVDGVKSAFGIQGRGGDSRTLLLKASKLTQSVKPRSVNFASLELEKSTAHQQMILTAQIHKYIDEETPIRLLIAECEDSLTPLGMLYLAKLYGLENHLDISPLFETTSALNNGGRIIGKMLSNPVYRDYVKKRGIFAIQTGFSDAGRFMGQIPATLAIERLQSHFASQMAKHDMGDVTSIVFNTHGESMGRGGHPGSLKDRMDYVMSPWAMRQFEANALPLCHETSFQGGDGFLWFQNEDLTLASLGSLVLSRYADHVDAANDIFYSDRDFSWDMFTTMSSEQDSLYNDPNYVSILGGFGQNLLIPTGSRASKRVAKDQKTITFNPRQLRAIQHNAILQQFGVLANVTYGLGQASGLDAEKFLNLIANSARAHCVFTLATSAMNRSNIAIMTAYARLFDPGFWISRALSGNEPDLAERSLIVANTLSNLHWRAQIVDLTNRLRMDAFHALRIFDENKANLAMPAQMDASPNLSILHALRIAVLMKTSIVAADLPVHSNTGTSRLDILQRLQSFQIDSIIHDLKTSYPAKAENLEWTKRLLEKTEANPAHGNSFPHLVETITKPLIRASQLTRQITIAITHHYDAFG